MTKTATAGNKGKGIRSDCFVTLEIPAKKTLEIRVESKVETMYGKAIRQRAAEVLKFFGIEKAILTIEDSGALDFVLTARLEAAIKKLFNSDKSFLLPELPDNSYETARDRNRFSRLYLPGNTPSLMINAGIHHPDGIILDLEDAVAPDKKFEAAFLVRNALRNLDFYGAERMVRINQVPRGLDDLDFVIPQPVNLILVPKCEHASQLLEVNNRIESIQKQYKIKRSVWLMPIIESALGVVTAHSIASAAPNVVSVAIGLEDYTADLGTRRTAEGTESFYARSAVVNAARAAGIQPIDSVFSDVADSEGLKQNVIRSKSLGFDGMGCIHPRQIAIIHENFAPVPDEIERAKKIVLAFDEATAKGLGVVSLGTKMIDPPVVKRALKTIHLAIQLRKLSANWKEEQA